MTVFILGLVLFFGVHSVSIVAPGWRDVQLAKRGQAQWKGLYSLVSLVGLLLLLYGFGLARQSPVILYTPPRFLHHIALALMLPVFPLLLSAYLPGRLQRLAKHPMLLAVKIWATAHLMANGMLVDVLLFGAFLVWAIVDRIAVKRRVVAHATPGAPASAANDAIAIVVGLAVYAALVGGAHRWLFGVSPLG